MRVYLDSCIVIYLVEEHLDYGPRLATILADLSKDTEIFLQLSDLTELECLVLPLRQKNQPVLDKYRAWFESVEILSLGREVFRRAAQLRADFVSLKTPDAIHLATAQQYACDQLWTNYDRLHRVAPRLARNVLQS